MMKCLIVGTDRLGSAPAILKEKFNVNEVVHWSGRKKPKCDMQNLDLIIVYTGFVNHSLMRNVKSMAKKNDIKTIYINRGLSELANKHIS